MPKKMTELEAWEAIADLYETKQNRYVGICALSLHLRDCGRMTTRTQLCIEAKINEYAPGRLHEYRWPSEDIASRIKFCRKMAKLAAPKKARR